MVGCMPHPTVAMTTPAGEQVEIDADISDLISLLWEYGWETTESCQNHGGGILAHAEFMADFPHMASYASLFLDCVMIGFASEGHLLALLNTIAQNHERGSDPTLYERMTHWAVPGAWQVLLRPVDFTMFDDGGPAVGVADFDFMVPRLMFPISDVSEVAARLAGGFR